MSTKAERMAEAIEREQASDRLREMFPAGSTVHTTVAHVSSSGMSRSIKVLRADGADIEDVSFLVARACGDRIDRTYGGVIVRGAGMDMAFHLVYSLARVLYAGTAEDSARAGYLLTNRNL